MTEIELKAHVENPEALKARLETLAEYAGAFEKEDAYWFPKAPGLPIPSSGIRVRRERDTAPGGETSVAVHVTYKAKELRSGIEINDEKEFDVSGAEAFEELLCLLGFEKGSAKKKTGWAYRRGRISAELCLVEGLGVCCASRTKPLKIHKYNRLLGWFIELEILSGQKDRETLDRAREELLRFLGDAGVSESMLESRYYTEMIED